MGVTSGERLNYKSTPTQSSVKRSRRTEKKTGKVSFNEIIKSCRNHLNVRSQIGGGAETVPPFISLVSSLGLLPGVYSQTSGSRPLPDLVQSINDCLPQDLGLRGLGIRTRKRVMSFDFIILFV